MNRITFEEECLGRLIIQKNVQITYKIEFDFFFGTVSGGDNGPGG